MRPYSEKGCDLCYNEALLVVLRRDTLFELLPVTYADVNFCPCELCEASYRKSMHLALLCQSCAVREGYLW